jgi:SAM-dependent methyltransferase
MGGYKNRRRGAPEIPPMSIFGAWLGYSYRRRLLDKALMAVAPTVSGRVLDVGGTRSGRGRFSPHLCAGAASWIRFNLSPSAGPDVIADGARLPVRDGAADSVICTEVLEYVDSPADMFQELSRVLRPGGIVLLSVPFVHRVDAGADRWRFSEPWLKWQVQRCSMNPVTLVVLGGPLATCAQILKTSLLYVSSRPIRLILGLLAWPFLEGLFALDDCWKTWNQNTGWTTGYLLVARKLEAENKASRPSATLP